MYVVSMYKTTDPAEYAVNTDLKFLNQLRDDSLGLAVAEADDNLLSMLDHEGEVPGHAGESGKVVEGDSDVGLPGTEGTPQALHLPHMLLPILQ